MAVKNQKTQDQIKHAFNRLNEIKRWAVHKNIEDARFLQNLLGIELNIRAIQRENYENGDEVEEEGEG